MKKHILNISRLHQQELWSIIKMLPDDSMNAYVITGYKIINPDDASGPEPFPGPVAKDVTVAQYEAEVAAYQQKHQMDLSAPGIQILETYTKENVLAPEIVDNIKITDASTVPPAVTKSDYDLIVVGIGDAGVDIFKKCGGDIGPDGTIITPEYSQLQVLSDARDVGVPIVFTHDCLEVNSFCEPFPDDYGKLVGNFGVDSWSADYGDEGNLINNISCIAPSHAVMNAYFTLPETLEVQPAHSGGLTLKAGATIIYEEAARTSGKSNYYLAVFEQAGKGKVVICQLGHSNGNFNQFFRPSIDECKILVNAIVWALQ